MLRRSASLASLCVPLALLPLLALPAAAQHSLVVRSDSQGSATLLAVDATGAATVALDKTTFLPLQLAGFARSERLVASLPTLSESPVPAVRLPSLGSLHRVQRPGGTGWLHTSPDGGVALLAVAADGLEPGHQPWLAVARDGGRALVAATAEAGGQVSLLDLSTDTVTTLASGQTVVGESLRLGPDHAWWIADGALWSQDLQAGTGPVERTPALGATESLHPELVLAADGRSVAVLSEAGPLRRRLHVVDAVLGSTTVSAAPEALDAPDLDSPVGPFVALSPDGTFLAWRANLPGNPGQTTKELFLQRIDLPAPAAQVTGDAQFTDTIDIVGVFGFVGTQRLFFMAGEKPGLGDPPQSLGSADLFLVDTNTGVTQNVSATSGEPAAPFTTAGELEVLDVCLDTTGQRLLAVADPDNGDFGLYDLPLDGSTGWTILLDELLLEPVLVAAGDQTLVVSHAEQGFPPIEDGLHRLLGDGTFELLSAVPDGLTLDRFTTSRHQPWAAFAVNAGPDTCLPVLLDRDTGALIAAWPFSFTLAPALAFTPGGDLALGVGVTSAGPFVFGALGVPAGGGTGWMIPKGQGFPLAP